MYSVVFRKFQDTGDWNMSEIETLFKIRSSPFPVFRKNENSEKSKKQLENSEDLGWKKKLVRKLNFRSKAKKGARFESFNFESEKRKVKS